jgi:hypothetical protein
VTLLLILAHHSYVSLSTKPDYSPDVLMFRDIFTEVGVDVVEEDTVGCCPVRIASTIYYIDVTPSSVTLKILDRR